MKDQELKKIAADLLANTAIYNYDSALDIEAEEMKFSDEDYEKLNKLAKTAKISVTWDE